MGKKFISNFLYTGSEKYSDGGDLLNPDLSEPTFKNTVLDITNAKKSAQYIATYLEDLHSIWQPHAGQVPVGRALFHEGKTRVFLRCGRKYGKTELEIYTLYRWAGTTPGGQFYYVAPFYSQAAEIIWHPGRLKHFLGKHSHKYIDKIYEQDRRIVFKTGSFIKLVGADNHQAGRGFNPDGGVYDEFKDHDYRFHQGFVDNLITKKAPLLIVGTPPDNFDNFFVRTEEDFKADPRGAYFKMPQSANPYIDPIEAALEKASMIRKGEWAKYMREIEAEIVPGGANAIFPMFEIPRLDSQGNHIGDSIHVKAKEEIDEKVLKYPKDYSFYCAFDPGSALVFGVLFIAVHKFSKQVLVLDEIYETDRSKTTGKRIYPRAVEIMNRYAPVEKWFKIYDHAAAWFQIEINNEFRVALTPCTKDVNKKDVALSVIKDFFLDDVYEDEKYLLTSNRAKKFIWEISSYCTDEKGDIPKRNDHLIDTLRYIFNAAYLSTVQRKRHQRPDDRRVWKEIDYMDDEEILNQPIDFDDDITQEFWE